MSEFKIKNKSEQAVLPGDPEHPGGWIKRNLLEPNNLKVAEAARRMKINRVGFIGVLDGKHAVSRDLAYKLEALTGVDAELLIRMQLAHDLAQERETRANYARDIERVPETA